MKPTSATGHLKVDAATVEKLGISRNSADWKGTIKVQPVIITKISSYTRKENQGQNRNYDNNNRNYDNNNRSLQLLLIFPLIT